MFGKSLFQSVLERIEAEDPRDAGEASPRAGIAGFNAGLAFDTERAAGSDTVRQAYAEMDEAGSTAPEPPLPRPAPGLQTARPLPGNVPPISTG